MLLYIMALLSALVIYVAEYCTLGPLRMIWEGTFCCEHHAWTNTSLYVPLAIYMLYTFSVSWDKTFIYISIETILWKYVYNPFCEVLNIECAQQFEWLIITFQGFQSWCITTGLQVYIYSMPIVLPQVFVSTKLSQS